MKKNIKKIVPKVGRKLKNFLTDESGKIAKKDILALGVGTAMMFGAEEMSAAPHSNHSNIIHSSASSGHANQGHMSGYERNGHLSGAIDANASVASLRGHYSGIPSAHQSGFIRGGHLSQAAVDSPTHSNSSSHSNHSNY